MKTASEMLCLNWNDFQNNINSSFQEMRNDLDLADVTLACEGRKQFQAHKFVLSSSSPLFKEILRNNKHPHPLIFLKGMKPEPLESVLDFLYMGEVRIFQEDLNEFLAAAEELEVKGLTGLESMEEGQLKETFKDEVQKQEANSEPQIVIMSKTECNLSSADIDKEENSEILPNIEGTVSSMHELNAIVISIEDNTELKEQISSMMQRVDGVWKCNVCGRTNKKRDHIVHHIDSNHIDASHPCSQCGKISRSMMGLRHHKRLYHIVS